MQQVAEIQIARLLEPADVPLGIEISLPGTVVIQMFLKEIQQYCRMGRHADIFQLMTGKFVHNQGIRCHLLCQGKGRYPDVAHEQTVRMVFLQHMVNQAGCSAFALGAGDANDLIPKGPQKEFSLGGNLVPNLLRMRKNDAGTFENQIIVRQMLLIIRAKNALYQMQLGQVLGLLIRNGQRLVWQIPPDQLIRGLALPAKAQKQQLFSPQNL